MYASTESKIRKQFVYAECELSAGSEMHVGMLVEAERDRLSALGLDFQVHQTLSRGLGSMRSFYATIQLVASTVDDIPAREVIPEGYRTFSVGHLNPGNSYSAIGVQGKNENRSG